MSTIAIQIQDEKVELRFGFWTLSELSKRGYKLADLATTLKEDPFGFLPIVTYLGACGVKRDLFAYDESVFWDHYDSSGFDTEDTSRVMTFFTDSIQKLVSTKEKKSIPKAGKK